MLNQVLRGLLVLLLSFFVGIKPVSAQDELKDQIITDLITVGITGAATLTGNIPLAMVSGVLSKYISTYGVRVRVPSLIISSKRNLYESMINMRSNVNSDGSLRTIRQEIEQLERDLSGNCSTGKM